MLPDPLMQPQVIAAITKRFGMTGQAIVVAAKSLAPKKTGRLAGSIRVLGADAQGTSVGTDVEYADEVELGANGRAAKPFLGPSLDVASATIKLIWSA